MDKAEELRQLLERCTKVSEHADEVMLRADALRNRSFKVIWDLEHRQPNYLREPQGGRGRGAKDGRAR
jgi:hypothetical protein